MEQAKILTANYLDILFENRNKEYGAYQLRNTYEKRLLLALGITTALIFVFVIGAYLKEKYTKPVEKYVIASPTIISIDPIDDKAEKLPPPPPPPAKAVDIPKVQTIKLTNPVVVDNNKVIEPPPSQSDMAESKISNITQDGVKDANIVIAPENIGDRKGIIDLKKTDDDNGGRPFEKVEIDAKYPGGANAWKNFLERNLRGETPIDNGATPGLYTVMIQFIVDKDGTISDIKPLTNIGFGMEEEAKRVLKKSGKWQPAIQNGREVKAYRKQPITFQVLEQ